MSETRIGWRVFRLDEDGRSWSAITSRVVDSDR